MDLIVNRKSLLKGLYLAQGIADRKSATPAVANILLRSEGKKTLICAATDLRTSMIAELPASISKEGGIALGAKHFYEIVRSLPGDEIHFRKQDNHWAEISAANTQYKLVGMSDRDFPRLHNPREVEFKEIDARVLTQMIGRTLFSVSTDDTRYHLSGVYLECDGQTMRMVSTDGHRLSKVEAKVGNGPVLEQGVIVPRKGIIEVKRLIESIEGTCDIGFSQGTLFVRASDVVLSITLVDANFPPYKQVIPVDSEKKVVIDRTTFLEALRRISIMSSERSWGVRMNLTKKQLRISSDNPDLGEAQEDLEVDYSGSEVSIGFNARYFIDVLGEIDTEKVVFELNGELDPGLLRPFDNQDYLGVVMPMRI